MVEVVRHRLQQNYWRTFYDKHQQLYVLYEDLEDDQYFTTDYFSAIEDEYLNAKMQMTSRMVALIGVTPAAPVNNTRGASPAFSTTASSLPKLTLPSLQICQRTHEADTTNQCIRSLPSLGRSVVTWDDWLVQSIVFNLDPDTSEDSEVSLEGVSTFPIYSMLLSFLENRIKSSDTAHCSDTGNQPRPKATSR
ncbi:hypothetical protein TSAR_001803 [Trichomalopsis sarcophagae]|uniref:Uncharacterized protein n=1 Tax=Trichomalopsis sarcophagae TaxID=543379 RepID=A0A232EMJ4_9HYME|nr:hypothetical protein TSAR_001803 [Trichomalopsis sarcophagae]